jgi:hypothetical protein
MLSQKGVLSLVAKTVSDFSKTNSNKEFALGMDFSNKKYFY